MPDVHCRITFNPDRGQFGQVSSPPGLVGARPDPVDQILAVPGEHRQAQQQMPVGDSATQLERSGALRLETRIAEISRAGVVQFSETRGPETASG